MRGSRKATGVALLATAAVAACQAITGLGDLNKVDCLECDAGLDSGPPCAHTFCASFDEGVMNAGWKSVAQSPGTKLELDTTNFKSPPAALLVDVPSSDAGRVAANLGQSFARPLKGAHLELDLRVSTSAFPEAGAPTVDAALDAGDGGDAADDASASDAGADAEAGADGGASTDDAGAGTTVVGGVVRLASLSAADATQVSVALAWLGSGPAILVYRPNDGGAQEIALRFDRAPPLDAWVHVKIDVVFDAAGAGSVRAEMDGALAVERSGLAIVGAGAPASQLELGLTTRSATPAFKVDYDNLTLDLDP